MKLYDIFYTDCTCDFAVPLPRLNRENRRMYRGAVARCVNGELEEMMCHGQEWQPMELHEEDAR